MGSRTIHLFVTMAPALLVAGIASAATLEGMQAGAWNRTTRFEVTSPLVAKLLPDSLHSTVCISPQVAKRGPIAIALVEDGPDCRLTSSKLGNGSFSATRNCLAKDGRAEIFNLTGHFTSSAIELDSMAHTARGTPIKTSSELRRIGPCQANTPLPGQ